MSEYLRDQLRRSTSRAWPLLFVLVSCGETPGARVGDAAPSADSDTPRAVADTFLPGEELIIPEGGPAPPMSDPEAGIPEEGGAPAQPTTGKTFNDYIMEAARNFGTGSYDFNGGSGVTRDIVYQGKVVIKADDPGNPSCHCVGGSFQAFMEGFALWDKDHGHGSLGGITEDQVIKIQKLWYGQDVQKGSGQLSQGAQIALVTFGLGVPVTDWSKLQAGDPVVCHGLGEWFHAGLFEEWIEEDGEIVGFTHFTCGGNGPGFYPIYLGTNEKGKVDLARSFAVHPLEPDTVTQP